MQIDPEILLEMMPQVLKQQESPMVEAILNNDISTIKKLLKQGIDLNYGNGILSLLTIALTPEQYYMLVEPHNGMKIKNPFFKIAQLLIDNGADVNNDNFLIDLCWQPECTNIEVIEFLLDNGANVNLQDDNGNTALMHVSSGSSTDFDLYVKFAKLLLKYGADVRITNNEGADALLLSYKSGNIELSKLLLQHGTNPNNKDNLGLTILMYSSINYKMLIDKINKKENNLQKKVDLIERITKQVDFNKQYEYTKLLIEERANLDITHQETGLNAYEIAEITENKKVMKAYIEYGIQKSFLSNKVSKMEDIFNFLIENIYEKEESFITSLDLESDNFDFNNPLVNKEEKNKYLYKQQFPYLKNSNKINEKNSDGKTALLVAIEENNIELIKELLSLFNPDIEIVDNFGNNLDDYIDVINDKKIKNQIRKLIDAYKKEIETNNHPQKLVKILTNFTSPDFKPIRFTTHSWDFDLKKEYGNFENFMQEVKKQWGEFKDELENLSPNLYLKIESFLFETDRAKRIGWSSLKDLQQWCDDGKNPFDLIVGDKKFEEYIQEFKKEIEIRKEQNHLETLFIAQRKKLGRKFNVELERLKGKTFYTDVERFTLALDKIFNAIKDNAHEEKNTIEVKAQDAANGEYIDIIILHKNSFSSTDAKTLAREAKDGDFSDIRKNLTNLCDWSVQNYHEGKAYQINYLRSDNSKELVELEEKPEGFTHILRFYK